MGQWKKSACILCSQNCGLELFVENGCITRAKGDKDNPRSKGYVCPKGPRVMHHQHHGDRLTHPLKKVGGSLEQISWGQAVREIAARLQEILDQHGPRSLAYVGGGGQGCHFEAAFGVRLLRALGSQYHYNALGQELTGHYWVSGRFTGKQYLYYLPDENNCDLLLGIGWNGWMSHQMPQARKVLSHFSQSKDKLLVIIDPRRSETARMADMHLAIRAGADAILLKALIALILEEGWEDRGYLARHTTGWGQVSHWFKDFEIAGAVETAGLEFKQVHELARLLTSRRWAMHPDLGVFMGRHSTLTSYLYHLLAAVCGRLGMKGGCVLPGTLMPLGAHSDERNGRTWSTVATGFPAIMGVFPPNVIPEEILSDHPERLRAVICSQSNPLRSYADSSAYEKAWARLELSVCCETAWSETAMASDYVLPARTGYESWDGAFFAWTWPGVFFQMRRPIVEPEGEPLEVSQIFTLLADELGIIPEIPQNLCQAASGDRLQFATALLQYAGAEPKALKMAPYILAKTLGPVLGSGNLAALWGLLMTAPSNFQELAVRAGFPPGPAMGESIFQKLLDNPSGIWVGQCDSEDNMAQLATEDKKVNVHIPELVDWLQSVHPESEALALAPDPEWPLILCAGRRLNSNANSIMRDPEFYAGRKGCTVALNPKDAGRLGLEGGQRVRVATTAGAEVGELETDDSIQPGTVVIPHGFGLMYQGRVHGMNVNRLTPAENRDPVAGTPLHRYVPCRVEAV